MSNILAEARLADPGAYLTPDQLADLEREDNLMAARVRAARSAERMEQPILRIVIETILKQFGYEARHEFAKAKCYRDVGSVYRHCVFAMLCDDVQMLEDKLLFWLRTVLQAQGFPESNKSIAATYALLRKEVLRQLPPEDSKLLDPYFIRCAEILPN